MTMKISCKVPNISIHANKVLEIVKALCNDRELKSEIS
jgi:hypothetical protein